MRYKAICTLFSAAVPPTCPSLPGRGFGAGRYTGGREQSVRMPIAGMDGYLGWSLAVHLAWRGHEVAGANVLYRRSWVEEMGSASAIPIAPIDQRLRALRGRHTVSMVLTGRATR